MKAIERRHSKLPANIRDQNPSEVEELASVVRSGKTGPVMNSGRGWGDIQALAKDPDEARGMLARIGAHQAASAAADFEEQRASSKKNAAVAKRSAATLAQARTASLKHLQTGLDKIYRDPTVKKFVKLMKSPGGPMRHLPVYKTNKGTIVLREDGLRLLEGKTIRRLEPSDMHKVSLGTVKDATLTAVAAQFSALSVLDIDDGALVEHVKESLAVHSSSVELYERKRTDGLSRQDKIKRLAAMSPIGVCTVGGSVWASSVALSAADVIPGAIVGGLGGLVVGFLVFSFLTPFWRDSKGDRMFPPPEEFD